jgi:hypothetical protein
LFFSAHFQSKTNQLAENDIVGMFAENLVEVSYVWCAGPGFYFHHIHSKNFDFIFAQIMFLPIKSHKM